MFKIIMITAVILALNQLSEAIPKPTSVGDSCTPGRDSYECDFIGADYGFCHFRTNKCQKLYRGCSITTEQITCLSLKTVLPTIQKAACGDDQACHDGFEATIASAAAACDIVKAVVCDDANCPQNHYHDVCSKLKKGKWKLN